MKAVIMAGGEGARLRPLTCDMPKPMMPVLDVPLMEYALRLLRRHGVSEAAVTLGYMPDCVRDCFGTGARLDMKLMWRNSRSARRAALKRPQSFWMRRSSYCRATGLPTAT